MAAICTIRSSKCSVAEAAALTHIRLQDEASGAFHLSTLYAEIAERGTYDSFGLNLGARIARTEAHVRLAGAKGIAHLNGAQLLGWHAACRLHHGGEA